MRILLTGQCTLHWGRMEFGNLGNYAIIEPFIRELHRVFPNAEIRTSFQMSDAFCAREHVIRLPLALYYAWKHSDLWVSMYEGMASWVRKHLRINLPQTAYMKEVLCADLVVDFSGDIWGENASLVGKNRYFIGVLKDLTAHWMGKPIALLAGSPGPFQTKWGQTIARFAMKRFDLVTNREPISTRLLQKHKISPRNVHTTACPAFLFQSCSDENIKQILVNESLDATTGPTVGLIICGWNMPVGPYSRWPRNKCEYEIFAEVVEYLTTEMGFHVCMLSHNNAFTKPPDFQMMSGRDYLIVNQLNEILLERTKAKNFTLLSGVYDAAQTKAIIRHFDMLISGRIHGAVAGLSQSVPTVIVDYGHEPKAHKLRGFAEVVGVSEYVADPSNKRDLIEKIVSCWDNRIAIQHHLADRIPEVQTLARENFDLLYELFDREKDI